MSHARRLALRMMFVLCAVVAGVLPAAAQTIGGYVLVRQQRIGPITFLVYRATLSSPGGSGLAGATATVTSSVRATIVLDGQLTFGPLPPGGSVLSQDTITLMHIGPSPFSLSALRWTVTAQPTPAARSLRISPIPSSVPSGVLFAVTVEAMNGASIDAAFTGSVTLSAAAAGGSNFTAGNVVNAVAGVASFNVFLNNAANAYVLDATATSMVAAQSNAFNVTADHLWVAQSVSDVAAGTAFTVATEARDANNALAENFTGTITLSAAAVGGANFNGGSPTGTAASGAITFGSLALNNAASGYVVTATSAGLSNGTSNPFDVGPHHLTFTTPPASVRAGTLFSVAVEARDANDGVAENVSGTVTLNAAATGGSNFSAGNTVNAVAGVATFTVFLNDAANAYVLDATATGMVAAHSNAFNVTADHLWVTQSISDVAAGTAFTVATEARDANNGLAENFTGTITLSAAAVGGANFNGGSPAGTAASGAINFGSLALNNAASGYVVTATSAGLSNGISNPFDVGPHHLTFTTLPASVRAGTLFSVAVEARDANDGVAENVSGTVTLNAAATGGSNFNGGSRTATAIAGVATFNGLFLNDSADGYTLSASASGAAATSNAFNVTADHLWVTQSISDVAAGTAFNVTTEARDANNGLAENFTGTITLSAAAVGGANFNGGSPTGTAASGAINFGSLALNNAASGYVVTATNAGLSNGTSNPFDVGPHHLTFTTPPPGSVRAGDAFGATVEARDADDNVAENFSSTVTLSAAATGGSNFNGGSRTATALAGAVTFSALVLTDAADGYVSSAGASGASAAFSSAFNVTARNLLVLPVANQIAGVAFDVTVQALDANGSVAENFAGTIGLSASAGDGADFATSPSGPALAGITTFSGLILQTAATGYSITASAPAVAGGTSNLFDVDAATAAVLSVDGVGYAPSKVFLGGGFGYLPAHADYTLTNTGSAPMSWSAEVSDPWLTVSPASGTLDPGASVAVQLSIDAAIADTLLAAEYTGRVYFSNRSGGTGSTTRPVYLALNGIWPLRVRPAYSFLATGSVQTPPAPPTFTYTLTNLNTVIPVDWSGTSNQSWVQLSSSGGTVPGFQSVQVTATLTPGPTGFPLGTSAATLTFTQFNCCPDLLNFRFVKVIITEDDPPGLTVDAPVPDVLSTTLSGTVTDNGTIAALVWSNARTGQTGTIDVNQGAWTVTIPLMVGTNDVTVTAFDDLGNFSSRTLSIDATSSPVAAQSDRAREPHAASGYIVTATRAGLSDGTSSAFEVTVEARDANNNVAENLLSAAAVGGSNFAGGSDTATG